MVNSVLIMTSSPGLGEVVRRTLVESGRYEVVLSTNALQAIQQAKIFPFSIAIIDVDLEKERTDMPLSKLGLALRQLNPEIHIVALSSSNDPYDPDIKTLAPEGVITTPLYPSSILRTVDRIAGIPSDHLAPRAPPREIFSPLEAEKSDDGLPAWLQDVTRAAQHLTRLSLETASQAALIVSEERLWAYAGELPQPAAQELAETVVHYWGRNGESDLARFVRLESDGGEYLLYATALGSRMVLALVFGVETPFSKIRSQVVNLARLLASPPAMENEAASAEGNMYRFHHNQSDKIVDYREEGINDKPLFQDIPSPSPQAEGKAWADRDFEYPERIPQALDKGNLSNHSSNIGPTKEERSSLNPLPAATRVEQRANLSNLEGWTLTPLSAGIYHLSYGILLIPRLPDHHLVGDLADRVPLWVSQLCVAFDWRLEHISVRPDYLQWNASAAPEIPPAQMVRNIRKHTSIRIFEEFPVLGRANPSGDFWATSFLLITGSQPPSGKLVQDFIQQTRNKQGITRPVFRQNR
jgi:REP element-mobilizing transposase RayT/CheY-like chemotaxis protein